MRILLTVPSLAREYGGPVVKATRLTEELRRLGHEVQLIGVGEREGAVGLPRLAGFHGTPIPSRWAPLGRAAREADVVHAIGYRDPVGSAAILRARGLRVLEPVGMFGRIVRSERLKSVFDRTVGSQVVERADLIVATSRQEAAELVAGGIAEGKIRIRPNGVDPVGVDVGPHGAARRRFGIPRNAPLVLILGRINRKKRLPDLVAALAGLPAAWCLIAGPDDRDGALQDVNDALRRFGMADRVRVEPAGLWEEEKLQALSDADAFCLPSEHENFGNAPAEAAMVGLPVVLTDHCGVVEWLSRTSCEVVPVGDVVALAAALQRALAPEQRQAARRAVTELQGRLSWPAVAAQQLAIYEAA